jgi:hypothetical protein
MSTLTDGLNGFSQTDLSGKKRVMTDSNRVDSFEFVQVDFMKQIFNLNPVSYIVTDDSSLDDFILLNVSDEYMHGEIKSLIEIGQIGRNNTIIKIKQVYNIDVTGFELLINIFEKIKGTV